MPLEARDEPALPVHAVAGFTKRPRDGGFAVPSGESSAFRDLARGFVAGANFLPAARTFVGL